MNPISPRTGSSNNARRTSLLQKLQSKCQGAARRRTVIGLLCALPLTVGCASQGQIQDFQDEIRGLREERTQLRKENRGLQTRLGEAQAQLIDASSRQAEVIPAAAETTDQDYSELDAVGVDYGTRDGNFMISLPAGITFASGSAELTKQGRQALRVVAQTLQSQHSGGTYWIEGHTDNDPIRKSKWESNRQLSVSRAMAVHAFLVEDSGFGDDQFVVAGHGEYLPIAANDSPAGKARNRRVEIVVHMAR
ncbi:MAG: chemotaxis protein MotB [Planctomycetota bacterium]|jgi:chemotaxis protein MotB